MCDIWIHKNLNKSILQIYYFIEKTPFSCCSIIRFKELISFSKLINHKLSPTIQGKKVKLKLYEIIY